MTDTDVLVFRTTVLDYYQAHGRHDMPWRIPGPNDSFDPYKILVSELMLQQTQVVRVTPKFLEFMTIFPTVQVLAAASLGQVLTAWSGLGYNRRAKYLHQAAQMIIHDYAGVFPDMLNDLVRLPGVGRNTAGAIIAYAFNKPAIFIETNIRTVYIHHFFNDRTDVADAEIIAVLERTFDAQDPRLFYWALMDYGAHLKQAIGNLNKLSKTYSKQSVFQGSTRQVRGHVIRLLTSGGSTLPELKQHIDDDRLPLILDDLLQEKMITQTGDAYRLA